MVSINPKKFNFSTSSSANSSAGLYCSKYIPIAISAAPYAAHAAEKRITLFFTADYRPCRLYPL